MVSVRAPPSSLSLRFLIGFSPGFFPAPMRVR